MEGGSEAGRVMCQEGDVPTIAVQRLREVDDTSLHLLQEIQTLRDTISRRAYDLYRTRGASEGGPLDDWLRAEREVCWVPQEELHETDRAVHVMIGLSGVADQTIKVTLLPETIILSENQGDGQHGTDSDESRRKALLHQIVLPSQIDTESAVIQLDADLLRVSAAKVELA